MITQEDPKINEKDPKKHEFIVLLNTDVPSKDGEKFDVSSGNDDEKRFKEYVEKNQKLIIFCELQLRTR